MAVIVSVLVYILDNDLNLSVEITLALIMGYDSLFRPVEG